MDGLVSSKINDNRDDFDFDIVIFPVLYGDVPRTPLLILFTSLNLFALLGCLNHLANLTPVIKV